MSSVQVVSGEYSYLPIQRVHFGLGSIARYASAPEECTVALKVLEEIL